MIISTAVPGCTYSAGVYTLPISALNTILTNDLTVEDSFEKLVFGLCQVLLEKQESGAFTQTNLSCEIGNHSVTRGIWETSTNSYSTKTLQNFLVSFPMGSTIQLLDGDSIGT